MPPPLLNRPLKTFLFALILANIPSRMYTPLLALYLQSFGASVEQVGLFFTLSMIAPLTLQILGGWISDSVGRLQAVAVGSMAGFVGYVVFVIAPSWQWMLLAVTGDSIATAFVAPSYSAYIAEQSTEATRGRVYGVMEGLFIVVGIVGPPLGGYLSESFGYKFMFTVAMALYGSATVIRLFMALKLRPSEHTPRPPLTLGGLKTNLLAMAGLITAGGIVTWVMISDGIRDVMWNLSQQLEPIYMRDFGGLTNFHIGWLVSISSVTNMLLTVPAGWLSDKKGERVGIVVGYFFAATGLLVFIHSRTFLGFAIAWLMYGMANALAGPALNSLISKAVPENLRGVAYGLFSTSTGVIALPAPYIGAQLWERISPQVPFYVPSLITLFMLPFIWVKFKNPRGDIEHTAALEDVAPAP